jgi:lipoprotein signal peptidase
MRLHNDAAFSRLSTASGQRRLFTALGLVVRCDSVLAQTLAGGSSRRAALLVGGALGNDRPRALGHVIDFIRVHYEECTSGVQRRRFGDHDRRRLLILDNLSTRWRAARWQRPAC